MRSAWQTVQCILGMLLRVLLLVLLVLVVAQDLSRLRERRRGIESGLTSAQPALASLRTGVNVSLERYGTNLELLQALETLREMGYSTLVQHFSWAELEPERGAYRWNAWDYTLDMVRAQGFSVVAVLDAAPAWARAPGEAGNPQAPPADPQDYARYAAAFASRYGDRVQAYQIWDRPNIYPHWGGGEIDPAGYVTLLQAASTAIREADPDGIIVAGNMAPTVERSGRNMSDVQFLREIYRRGAGQWFDVLGAKAFGFWSGPYDRRVDAGVLNFSRIILLREEMVRRGDGHKPIWALEGGWATLPEDWQGDAPPMGDDRPTVQASRLRDAFERVQREWPWLTLFCPLHLQPLASDSDPVWGLSLLSAEGQPQPLMEEVRGGLRTRDLYYPGYHHVSASLVPEGAALTDERAVAITFYGTDLAIVTGAEASGTLRVMPPFEDVVTLRSGTDAVQRHWLVRNLTPGMHTLHLVGSVAQIETIQALQVGNRLPVADIWMMIAAGSLLAGWLVAGIVEGMGLLDWRWPYRRALAWTARLPHMWGLAALAALFAVAIAAPLPAGLAGALLRLGILALYGLAVLLRPEAALLIAVASIPLAPLTVALGPGRFSITEIAILVAALARLGAALLCDERLLRIRSLNVVDLLLLVFLLWAAAGAVSAEHPREALREFRTVLAGPAVLYLLLCLEGNDRRYWQRLVQVLFASASAVALYALARYPAAAGVIEAEGVRRARAYFGSPNNLALYLERLLPLGVSLAIAARGWWRRGLYAAGTLAIGLAIGLTYSRGAWLLGVPAGLLAVGLLRGGRLRRYALITLAGMAVVLIPLSQTARLASLFDLQQGTSFLRVRLWQASWEMVKDYPWTGVGLDNFLYYYGDYILPGAEIERWLSHPHNLILNLWVRTGLGGLAIFIAMWGAALGPVVRRLRRGTASVDPILIGLLAGGVAMLAHGMIDSAFFVAELAYWSMFLLAYLVRERGLTDNSPEGTLMLASTNSYGDRSYPGLSSEDKARDQYSDLPDRTARGA